MSAPEVYPEPETNTEMSPYKMLCEPQTTTIPLHRSTKIRIAPEN